MAKTDVYVSPLVERNASRESGAIRLSDGVRLEADVYVFACGPWLAELFPELGADWIRPTRQEIYYFGTPAGDSRFSEGECPLWIDNGAHVHYGIPGSEWRGFKVASDSRGDVVEYDKQPGAI